jgi:hypothetical protein
VKAVAGVGIDHDLHVLASRPRLGRRGLDIGHVDVRILPAIQAEQRALDVGGDIERGLDAMK